MPDMPPDLAVDAVYIRLEGNCIVEYGSSDPAQLTIKAVDSGGHLRVIVFERDAMRQMARLFHEIAAELPGVILGH